MEDVDRIADRDVQAAYRSEMLQRFDQQFGFKRGRPGRQGGGRGPRGGRGDPGGPGRSPSPALGPRQPLSQLQRRQEQVLIATLVNHPTLLLESAEELAEFALKGRDTDALRRHLLDLAAEGQELDTVEIRRHLRQVTEEPRLDAVLSREIYRLWPFAEPAATVQEARAGLRHLLDLYRERTAVNETVEEGRRLAESMDQEHLARLEAKQRAVHEGESRKVDLDRHGSGLFGPGGDGPARGSQGTS